ncbi:hypothetical protein [Aestuariivirga sp.]|jgi:hypothetical protein|uniref:hypothetical protein n=1 Tax=Aestuariivirga sp. TaxID=2650926 RepID=UPI00378472DB
MNADITQAAAAQHRTDVERLSAAIADYLQELLNQGHNCGAVADAAVMAGASLRLHASGPLATSQILSTLAKRFAVDAVTDWALREAGHRPSN